MKRSEWVLVFQLVLRGEALEYLDTLIKFKMMVMMIMMMMMMEMIMKQTVSRKVQKKEAVSDFQNLSFIKRGYVQTLSCENEFYLHEHKKSFSSIAWHLDSP